MWPRQPRVSARQRRQREKQGQAKQMGQTGLSWWEGPTTAMWLIHEWQEDEAEDWQVAWASVCCNVVGDVAGHPGEEMSCKVKLSINWRVGPTLTCGRERLAVTWSTRLGIQAAEMRLAWPVALQIGQRVQSRAAALWCGWFRSCDQNASAFEPGHRPVG